MHLRRRIAAALACVVVAVAATPVAAESALWTMTASPLATTTGVRTTFTLQATNQDLLGGSNGEIGCISVAVPANFTVSSAAVAASHAGENWLAGVTGNTVRVWTTSGGDRLQYLEWVRFTVVATANNVGSIAWGSRAYRAMDCSGSGALLGLPPIVVVTGPPVTPTPVPTPAPTPPPTPTPTIPLPTLPVPTLPLPTLPVPTATPRPTPTPEATPSPTDGGGGPTGPGDPSGPPRASGTPAPGGSGGPDASPSDEPDPGGSGSVPGAPNSGGGPGGSGGNGFGFQPGRVDVGGPGLGVLGGIDVWIVPAASLAGPGLLILLWIALQAIGAVAWVPIVRRFRGAGEEPA